MFSGEIYIKLPQSDMLDVLNRYEFLKYKSLIVFLSQEGLYYVSGLLTASEGATVMISILAMIFSTGWSIQGDSKNRKLEKFIFRYSLRSVAYVIFSVFRYYFEKLAVASAL